MGLRAVVNIPSSHCKAGNAILSARIKMHNYRLLLKNRILVITYDFVKAV
jgi:hypothetical protein